jgi:hypothetical protein
VIKAQPAPEAHIEAYLARERRFDPDVWIVEPKNANEHRLLSLSC